MPSLPAFHPLAIVDEDGKTKGGTPRGLRRVRWTEGRRGGVSEQRRAFAPYVICLAVSITLIAVVSC